MNHQICPWIFMGRPNSSLNYAKYQCSPWICQTSIKKVPPSKCSVSHADLSPCMLCCLIHVARRKPRVQGLIWLIWGKSNFHFSVNFFCFSHFAPTLPIPPSSHFTQKHHKCPWPFSFPLKLSPFSPFKIIIISDDSHVLKFLCSTMVNGNAFPVVYQVFVFVFTLFYQVSFSLSTLCHKMLCLDKYDS